MRASLDSIRRLGFPGAVLATMLALAAIGVGGSMLWSTLHQPDRRVILVSSKSPAPEFAAAATRRGVTVTAVKPKPAAAAAQPVLYYGPPAPANLAGASAAATSKPA